MARKVDVVTVDDVKIFDSKVNAELNKACREYGTLKAQYEEAKRLYDECCSVIKSHCDAKRNSTGAWLIEMKLTPETLIFDSEKFKSENPAMYEQYTITTKAGSRSIHRINKVF